MSAITHTPSPSPDRPRSNSTQQGKDTKKTKKGYEFPSFKRRSKEKDKEKSVIKEQTKVPSTLGDKESKQVSPHPHRRSSTFQKVNFGDVSEDEDLLKGSSSFIEESVRTSTPCSRPDTADLFRTETPASIMDLIDNDSSVHDRHLVSDHLGEIVQRLSALEMHPKWTTTGEEDRDLSEVKHLLELTQRQVKKLEEDVAMKSSTSLELQKQLLEKPHYRKVNPEVAARLTEINASIRRLEGMNANLKKRLHQYGKAHKTTDFLKQRIYQLEHDKEELIKTNTELSTRTGSSTDLDIADLQHSNAQLREVLSDLQTKLERQKIDTRDQKERLVLKLFEIETVNLKAHEHQMDRQFLAMEHEQIFKKKPTAGGSRPRSASPEPGTALGKAQHRLKQTEAELQMQKAMMKQLELQNEQARGLVSSLLDQRLDLERQLDELKEKRPRSFASDGGIQIMGITSSEVENLRSKNAALQRQLTESRDSSDQIEKMAIEKDRLVKELAEREKDLTALQDIIQHHEEEHAKLTAELGVLHSTLEEMRQVRLDNQHIQHERDELDASVVRHQQRLNQLEMELSEAYEKVGQSQKETIDMKIALQEYQIERDSHAQEIERLQAVVSEHTTAVSENKELHEETKKLKSVIQKHEIDIYQLQEDMCSKDNASEEMSKQLQDTEQRMMELQKEFERLEEDRCELQEKLKANRTDLEDEKVRLLVQLEDSEADRTSLKAEAENLRKRLLTLTEDLSQLLSDKRILEKKVEALSSESPLLMKQRTDLLVSKERAEHQLQDVKKDLDVTRQRLADVETDRSELQLKIQALSEEVQSFVKEKAAGDTKLESLANELDRTKSVVIAKDAITRELSNDVESSRKQVEQLSKQLSELHRDKAKLEVTCRDSDRHVLELTQRAENAESTLKKVTTEEIPSYHKQLSEINIEKLKVSGEVSVLNTKLEGAIKENERLVSQVEELRSELVTKTGEYKETTSNYERELREARQELTQHQLQARKQEESVMSAKLDKDQSDRQVKDLKEQVANRDSDMARLQRKVDKTAGEFDRVTQEFGELEERNKRLISELSRAESKLSDLQSQLQSSSDEKSQVVETLQSHIRQLEGAQKKLKQEKESELLELRSSLSTSSKVSEQEMESLKKELDVSTAENEQLKAQLDLAKKWEAQYKQLTDDDNTLRKTVHDMISRSSQVQADNKDLLELLTRARDEMPDDRRDEAFRKLQEENERLEKEVSLISHWNESKEQEIHNLEDSLKQLSKKHKEGVERMARENERKVQMLQKELAEVESECKKLRQRLSGEEFEEYRTKLMTQQTLLAHLSEHNSALQSYVDTLSQQIADLGSKPPPSPALTFSVPTPFNTGEDTTESAKRSKDKSSALKDKDSKDKILKKPWRKRSRSVTPTKDYSVHPDDSINNGGMHAETEVDDLKAENSFLREKLKELQEQLVSVNKT
jgi:chromosome segregation ATPase